jgi:deazaflavin-dependent oxidoreductase (nitroreductase family)
VPYPRWLARLNKRVFNPRQVGAGKYSILTHAGRKSGATYRTPMDAFPTRTGFVLVVRYGPRSDWVRNVLAAGRATLRVDGEDQALTSPRLVGADEALDALVADGPPKDFLRAEDFLLMERVE